MLFAITDDKQQQQQQIILNLTRKIKQEVFGLKFHRIFNKI